MKNSFLALVMIIIATGCSAKVQAQSDNITKSLYAIEQGDTQKAMRHINEHLQQSPKDADALYVRARIYYDVDDNAAAINDCTAAIRHHNGKNRVPLSDIYLLRGKTYEYVEEYPKAESDYTLALKYAKDNIDILKERANLYFQMKNYTASDRDFNQILSINPTDAYAMVGLSRNLINQEKYTPALEVLDRVIRLNPEYGSAYKFRAQAHGGLEEPKKAIDDIIALLEKDEDWDNLYFISQFADKAYQYTILKLTSKIKDNEDNPLWLVARAMLYEEHKDYNKAIEDYKQMNFLFGDNDVAFFRMGNCFSNLEDHENAIVQLSRAIDLDPTDGNYYIQRGESKRKTGDLRGAIKDYTECVELSPMYSYGYSQRGWAKEMMGDYAGALEDHNSSIALKEDYAYAYLYRARTYQLLGRDVEAMSDFHKIIELDTIPQGGSCRAYALIELGKQEEAIAWVKLVVENDDDPGCFYDMACVYSRLERRDEAIEALKLAFENGYRSFGHIDQDDDMDNIRHMSEFQSLMQKYRLRSLGAPEEQVRSESTVSAQTCEVSIKRRESGTYEIPCTINDLPLTFIFDTGASTVTISSLEANFMLKNNYLSKSDIIGRQYFSTASGNIEEGTRIRLKNVKIGEFVLDNIEATVVASQRAPLLLGQSVLNRFGKVDIDYENMKIILSK